MPRRKNAVPSLLRHKTKNLAYATFNGVIRYFGSWPADHPEPPAPTRAAFDRALAEWLTGGRAVPPEPARRAVAPAARVDDAGGLTITELIARFWAWALDYYRDKDGRPTGEADNIRFALRPLNHLCGLTAASAFGPKTFKAVRELLTTGYTHPEFGPQKPLSRNVVNGRCRRIKQLFSWAAGEELVPATVPAALREVRGLSAGRTRAYETAPVLPVDPAVVDATLPHLPPSPAGLVRLQLLTGMRPGEACRLRLADLDRSCEVWTFRPKTHKTAHRGKPRVVYFGPQAQREVLAFVTIRCPRCGVEGRPPRIGSRDGTLCGPCADHLDEHDVCGPWRPVETQDATAFLFSPARDRQERLVDLRARRRTRVQPSQRGRRKTAPKRTPGAHYTTNSYGVAVARAAQAAGVSPWSPNQLRHLAAERIRKACGLEAVAAALGHSRVETSQIYAGRADYLGEEVARRLG